MSKSPKAAVGTARNRQRREKATALQASAGDYAQHIVESLFRQIDNSTKTLADVAKGSGVSVSTLKKWKRGAPHPTLAEITKCFAYLGWTLSPQHLGRDASEGSATPDEDNDATVAGLLTAYRLAYGPHTPDREAFQRILDETDAELSAEAASDQDRLFTVFDDCMGRAYELTFWQRFKKPRLDAVTKAEARTTRAFEALITTLNELLPPDTYETRCIAKDIERIELGLSNIRFSVDRRRQSYVASSEDHGGADSRGASDFHRAVLAILAGFYELAFAPSTVPADPGDGPFFRFVDTCYFEMRAVIQKLQPSERAGQKAVGVKNDALKKWARKKSSTMRARLETPLEERKAMLDFRQRSPAATSHHTFWDLAALHWRRRSDPANKPRKNL